MPGPKNQELGIRSPKRLRGGIDFPSWEGINRQNDPGAIRDTQLFTGINVRINGNEIICRGGEEKLHQEALTGCIYGFIEASANSSVLTVNDPGSAKLSRYYGGATPVFNTVFPQSVTLQACTSAIDASTPRRSLARFGDGIYQFGNLSADDSTKTFFRIILPPFDTPIAGELSFANQSKKVPIVSIPEFASSAQKQVRSSDTAVGPVLYIGSMTTGKVYTWDGVVLGTETSNLASSRHIMASFHEDVYAIVGDHMRARNGGLWGTDISLTTTNFVCTAAWEYLDKLWIVGVQPDMGGDEGVVLSYDGTSVTDHSATIATLLGDTDFKPADVNVFDGNLYILNYLQGTLALVLYNNTSFTIGPVDTNIDSVGCLEPNGDKMWFTTAYSIEEGETEPNLFFTSGGSTFELVCATPNTLVTDMKAF